MNKVDRYKILVRYLVSIGVAANQKDLGSKMGYNNESAFSQVINGKTTEPKNFTEKLKNLMPDLNTEWLETGNGNMIVTSQATNTGGQYFHGDITGDNPQFAARDLTNNPPCTFGTDIDKFVSALTAQAELTKEAHEIARKAQVQVDVAQAQISRLLSMLEVKFNIQPV